VRPALIRHELALIRGELALIRQELAVISGELAVIRGELAVISGELAVISGELAVISGELAVISGELALIGHELAVISGELALIRGELALISGAPAVLSGPRAPIRVSCPSSGQSRPSPPASSPERRLVQDPCGTWTPFVFAQAIASSYPASACRMTPIPGSLVSTLSSRAAASFVPSATTTIPACRLIPIPTPPP
jgi:hypothetical protein